MNLRVEIFPVYQFRKALRYSGLKVFLVWDHWADVSLRILALIAIIDSLSASFLSLLEKKFFESRTHLTHSPYAPMEKDIWIQQPQSVGSSVVALPPRPRGRRRIAARACNRRGAE